MTKGKKCYICYYSAGSYEDYRRMMVFTTDNIKKARAWTVKFNKIAKKWKEYYAQYEDKKYGFPWIRDEFTEKYYDRWNSLRDIDVARYDEIEFR